MHRIQEWKLDPLFSSHLSWRLLPSICLSCPLLTILPLSTSRELRIEVGLVKSLAHRCNLISDHDYHSSRSSDVIFILWFCKIIIVTSSCSCAGCCRDEEDSPGPSEAQSWGWGGGDESGAGVVCVLKKLSLQRVIRIESPEAGGTVLPASRWAVSWIPSCTN